MIFGSGSSATFEDCTISKSTAPATTFGGGGVTVYNGGAGKFVNTTITGNTASANAGVWLDGTGSTAIFEGCTIVDNTATSTTSGGGGVTVGNGGVGMFVNTTVTGNTASAGGGVWLHATGSATFEDCAISNNNVQGVQYLSQHRFGVCKCRWRWRCADVLWRCR